MSVFATFAISRRTRIWAGLMACVLWLPSVGAATAPTPQALDFFEKKIRPILVDRCYPCHSSVEKIKGGLNLETRAGWQKGGDTGAVIVAGDPEKSRLIEAVRYRNHDFQMPPKSPLAPDQVRDLEMWVRMGAPDPREPVVTAAPKKRVIDLAVGRQFWAFQPLAPAVPPDTRDSKWVQAPVDAFILAKLEERQIRPAPAAGRRALIRRATFDLTGLPPTPAEVEAFLRDDSPDAFTRVVDRLLASRHYGERWGRHWLDVARYADSNGLDENVAFGNAWRYRDYVITAFNDNKRYDQFVIEQLAGDLLPATDDLLRRHERLTALGFLSLGPKLLAEPDKVKLEMDLIDEQIETFGRTFLALTLGCARCHDHKFDPIPTADYYALAAIFKSTRTMDDLKTVATWHEPVVALPADFAIREAHERRLAGEKASLSNCLAAAQKELRVLLKTNALPADAERRFPTNTLAELAARRTAVKQLEADAPELPSTMGVTEHTNIYRTLPVHIRGSHLTLGQSVARGVPQVVSSAPPPSFADGHSGRWELSQWLVGPARALTARVMVNRLWRWHFGRGLVASTDNFGLLGERPSHPELLDWLAGRFIADGWDIKAMHRRLMLSSVYQMSAVQTDGPERLDPENRLLHHFPLRRLDAEEIRDAILFVSEGLDGTMGGKTLPLKNREFVFNHTSKDATTYESPRRAVYLPIIRNHVYDLFQQFDFPDPAVPNGSRNATVVAPQALLMMNSELVTQAGARWAAQLRAAGAVAEVDCLQRAYLRAYGRPPTPRELRRAEAFLNTFAARTGRDPAEARAAAWATFCQSLLAANEFIYLE